jgi:hypothetical protein
VPGTTRPEGGDKGREVVAEGTLEQAAAEPRSYTVSYLKELLSKSVRAEVRSAVGKKKPRSPPHRESERRRSKDGRVGHSSSPLNVRFRPIVDIHAGTGFAFPP